MKRPLADQDYEYGRSGEMRDKEWVTLEVQNYESATEYQCPCDCTEVLGVRVPSAIRIIEIEHGLKRWR